MVEYRPSADRAEYAAQSEEERRKTRDRQRRPDGSFYGDGQAPAQPAVEVVDRDITQWRTELEARQAQDTVERSVNPFGAVLPGEDTAGPFSDSVDLDAAWSDRRWLMFEDARQDAETTDPSEFYAWISRDRSPEARGDLDAARYERMVRGMGSRGMLPGESIEDWKARIRRTNESAADTNYGEVYRQTANRKAMEALGLEVTPEPKGTVEGDGGYKVVATPSATELSAQLKAAGQKDMVFIGWDSKYGAGQIMNAPMLMNREALYEFDNFPPDMKERVMEITRAYYEGMSPEFAWNEKRWRKAVDTAHNSLYQWGVYKSPFEAYEDSLIRWRAQEEEKGRTSGGGGYYGGGYGGGSASTKRITLTSATDAYYLLNQAMSTYLGRSPSQQELARFVKMLNAQEMANPTIATATGDTTMQEGGFNPAVFAEQFARGTEGSAEYQAATTFLDTLMGALDGQTGVI